MFFPDLAARMVVVEKSLESAIDHERKRKRRRKPKLTGLSKQRQKANARERIRMRSISAAMLQLRYRLPSSLAPKGKKLSKIQTLRFAIRYIGYLWNVLQQDDWDTEEHCLAESAVNEGKYLFYPEDRANEKSTRCCNYESETKECCF